MVVLSRNGSLIGTVSRAYADFAWVRLITDPRHAGLRTGEILVAERTDPGWIMLFPAAAGLLVERGSLLSHSAIVAREMGIPAVVSVEGITRWLRDGDWVELDGSSGVVRRVEPPVEATGIASNDHFRCPTEL